MNKLTIAELIAGCRADGWPDAEILNWLCHRKELADVCFPGAPRRHVFDAAKGAFGVKMRKSRLKNNATTPAERAQVLIDALVSIPTDRAGFLSAAKGTRAYTRMKHKGIAPSDNTLLRQAKFYPRSRNPD